MVVVKKRLAEAVGIVEEADDIWNKGLFGIRHLLGQNIQVGRYWDKAMSPESVIGIGEV